MSERWRVYDRAVRCGVFAAKESVGAQELRLLPQAR